MNNIRQGIPTLPDVYSDERMFRARTLAALKELFNRSSLPPPVADDRRRSASGITLDRLVELVGPVSGSARDTGEDLRIVTDIDVSVGDIDGLPDALRGKSDVDHWHDEYVQRLGDTMTGALNIDRVISDTDVNDANAYIRLRRPSSSTGALTIGATTESLCGGWLQATGAAGDPTKGKLRLNPMGGDVEIGNSTSGRITTYGSLAVSGEISFRGGPLPLANGGTGLAASPSMLTNLAVTTAANVLQASPRPGVTGLLPLANGGTGVSIAATNAARALHIVANGTVVSAGTLPVAAGGTGLASYTAQRILWASATGTIGQINPTAATVAANPLLAISPNLWAVNTEYAFPDGTYGIRFLGNITAAAGASSTVTARLSGVVNGKIISCGGWWQSGGNAQKQAINSYRLSNVYSYLYFDGADLLCLYTIAASNRDGVNFSGYDVWIRYTK